ncbi:hypothetical protein [Acinetobacter calcoaceticus]|uniref:hypothetical protein n=1 Tax=Acinetobacter calcoaceticus TaxID=471 RepID=UPI002273478D|nr:hypothetical protein [Acinetobacter calcoaceticus]GLG83681.1 hypothetical protein ACSO1_22040 [Acinetobacter calcoaceticus]
MANKFMSLQIWLKKDEGLKKQFLLKKIEAREDINFYVNEEKQICAISEVSNLNAQPEQQAVIENIQDLSKVVIGISNNTFEQLKKDFRIFKFNIKNKKENRVKKQLFIDQKTMTRFEQIIKDNNLETIQNGLSFLMDNLSFKIKELKELNRQNSIKMQFQNEQINFLQQRQDLQRKQNRALIIQHNKKIEKLSDSLPKYVSQNFKQQLIQNLKKILNEDAYTKVIESEAVSSLLDKLSEEIKIQVNEATVLIEIHDLDPRS